MTVLIIGYPESGKSVLAENMVTEMASPGERVYLATMIPCGDEGAARVERHRKMRESKGFETIEAPFDVASSVEENGGCADRTVLLECLSNLAANELFERHVSADAAADRISSDIARLKGLVRDLVIVSNHYEIKADFDEETVMYAKMLDTLNDRISAVADKVIRIEP